MQSLNASLRHGAGIHRLGAEDLPMDILEQEGGSRVVPFRWDGDAFLLLDQRRLPRREQWVTLCTAAQVARAISNMAVRGAPAIGIAGAFGMVLAARALRTRRRETFLRHWLDHAALLVQARPTAVNLCWAIERMKRVPKAEPTADSAELCHLLEKEALAIWAEDIRANLAIGMNGQALLLNGSTILTHCNAGALATGGYGTALGVIRAARSQGKDVRVLADETRPWLQGSRLTAWELERDQIPVTLIVDSAAGFLMQQGIVDAVVVGADRIAANGDVANKIGTYGVAVLARENRIPFYVAAPVSTLDPQTSSGGSIPIEERDPKEVTVFAGRPVAAPGASARNPAFDITPHHLVTAIVTEQGILRPSFDRAIQDVCAV